MKVRIFETARDAGLAAAADARPALRGLDRERPLRALFAAAASQATFLDALGADAAIDWKPIEAFHLDEYVGLDPEHPAAFGGWLRRHLFDRVRPGRVELIRGDARDPAGESERYASLLAERPIDVAFLGIGENGHLAFNDPPTARFDDPLDVRVVDLDEVSRQQQVHDGAFAQITDVPRSAITVTIPAILRSARLSVVVTGDRKASAVGAALAGDIGAHCPASILRAHPGATLYVDRAAARLVPDSVSSAWQP